MSLWKPYQASLPVPWDRRRAIHLHRRTVFGACWSEIERDLHGDAQAAVTRVLEGTCRDGGVPLEFESLSRTIGDAAVASADPKRLAAWWLYRCLYSPRPLEERMTLLWHNHFATSNDKVLNLTLMKAQNETLRRYGLSSFSELLGVMAHDPALLEWLDAPSNHAGRPNENFAREMLELFTLGAGNFCERDVAETARAFTGWTVKDLKFQINNEHHDGDDKTILGQTGKWSGDDVIAILQRQPSCAQRIAGRLIDEFCGENVVSETARRELAEGLHEQGLNLRWGVETILRSELFFSDVNIQSHVADPVSFLLMPLRALECWQSPPSTVELAKWSGKLGQQLFQPPHVGGWDGGRNWLSTRTVIARTNYLTALAKRYLGDLSPESQPPKMPSGLDSINDPVERGSVLGELLAGGAVSAVVPQVAERDHSSGSSGGTTHPLLELLLQPSTHLN